MNASYNHADFIGLNLDSNNALKNSPHAPQIKVIDSKTRVKRPASDKPLVDDRPAK